MQTTIVSWGNSQGIRIPKKILESLALEIGDKIEIKVEGDAMVIKKYELRKKKTLSERLAEFQGEYTPSEWETGESVGLEVF